MSRRLELLYRLSSLREKPLPERLRLRVVIDSLLRDAWSVGELKSALEELLGATEELAADWLEHVPEQRPLKMDEAPLVVVVDGTPADVWMEAIAVQCAREAVEGGRLSWTRLGAPAHTPDALASLLGLEGDPVEMLAARDIPYYELGGDEETIADCPEPLPPGKPVIIRWALLDRKAHRGEAHLEELVGALAVLLERRLPGLRRVTAAERRPLIVTTDHGLSLRTSGGRKEGGGRGRDSGVQAGSRLYHGSGGPYERLIFRLTWSDGRESSSGRSDSTDRRDHT